MDEKRLDSWKEIAAYLGRNVRTVIRWEREKGLPVHRVSGGQRQAVFAYQSEVEAWLRKEKSGIETEEVEDSTFNAKEVDSGATNIPRWIPHFRRRTLVALAALCVGGMLIFTTNAVLNHLQPSNVYPMSLQQLTDDGRAKENARTDGSILYFNETQGSELILMSAPISGHPIRPIETLLRNVMLQDLSQDGQTLLVTTVEERRNGGQLWTISPKGGLPQRVRDVLCDIARWSPNNRQIACAIQSTLRVMDADGSNAHTVGLFSSPIRRISWTPNGKRLRFVLEDITTHNLTAWEIIVFENRISEQAHLLMFSNCCVDWAWMNNQKTFAYVHLDSEGKQHLTMEPSSAWFSRKREAPIRIGTIVGLASTKMGNLLYLVVRGSPHSEFLKFEAREGKNFQSLLPGLSARFLSFSRDGQWITYVSALDNSLWRSRTDGTEGLQLTRPPLEVGFSSWSPDGKRIAFTGRVPGRQWRIFLIDSQGGMLEEAGDGNDSQGAPTWSPDGKSLLYSNEECYETESCWIRHLDLTSKKVEIVPGSHGLETARWSPDGKYVAAVLPEFHWLMLFDFSKLRWRPLAASVNGTNIGWSSDSQAIYADSMLNNKPVIEQFHITDGRRAIAINLETLEQASGQIDSWFVLSPKDSLILSLLTTPTEIYCLEIE